MGVTDLGRADRTCERHARDGECGRCTDHRRDIRVDVRVQRHYGRDDLDFVFEALGKQRTDRPVDKTANQRLFFARAPFALEKAARDLARSVGLFLVVDGQREKVPARVGGLAANRGDEYNRLRHIDDDGAVRLAGDTTSFKSYDVLAVLKRFLC